MQSREVPQQHGEQEWTPLHSVSVTGARGPVEDRKLMMCPGLSLNGFVLHAKDLNGQMLDFFLIDHCL